MDSLRFTLDICESFCHILRASLNRLYPPLLSYGNGFLFEKHIQTGHHRLGHTDRVHSETQPPLTDLEQTKARKEEANKSRNQRFGIHFQLFRLNLQVFQKFEIEKDKEGVLVLESEC